MTAKTYNLKPLGHLPAERRSEIAAELLTRYAQGEEIKAMCNELGICNVTAYSLLLREHEQGWKDVQISRALARLASAQEDLDSIKDSLDRATDALELARLREKRLSEAREKSGRWMLEKLLRRLFGDEVPADTGRINIQINLGSQPNVIEGESNALDT